MITRRDLLSTSIAAAGVGALTPNWLVRAARAQDPSPADPKPSTSTDGRILVVVLLAGGNDGLNTVVPYADEGYRQARPVLRIDADKVLKIDAHVGLHPSMKLLRERYEKGEVAVLQNVGYPQPNRSHFASMDIWQSADPGGAPRTGWLGRYADSIDPAGSSPTVLFQMGSSIPLALRRERTTALAMDNEDSFSIGPDKKHPEDKGGQEGAFRKLCECAEPAHGSARPSYTDIVRETAASGLASADEVVACLKKPKTDVVYPKNLGGRLSTVSRLIVGGMKTRAYFTVLGGFDTHARQRDSHGNLLQNFSDSVDAFYRELAVAGRERDVVVMAFSEFGRRVAENASAGTDHGAAGPVFVVGPSVKGGLYGSNPDFSHLVDGDVTHGIDFRSVYATLVKDWLGAPIAPAIQGEFPLLPFLSSA
jgi:uncharacterized protein (DUF1501 family)